jgi:XrtN system VIT domain protein
MIKALLREDKIWLTGLIFLLLSLLIFCTPLFIHLEENGGGLFICNYGIAIVYLIMLIASKRLKRGENGLAPLFVLLLISLVSCYSLNRNMNIFDDSVTWWSALLVISGINYLTIPFHPYFPRPLQYIVFLIAGISLIAFLYLAISLMPWYLVSGVASIAAGISLHTFVPLLFIIYTLVFVTRAAREHRPVLLAFFTGVAIAVVAILQFTIRWSAEVARVNYDLYATPRDGRLPAWVGVAQDCPPSTFNEHFLKTGLVYKTAGSWNLFSWQIPRRLDEKQKHDPLIVMATFFAGSSSLEDEDRIKILECLYDSRHQAQERLWRDDDLSTANVNTTVELWPQQHLSYTEEDVTVKSNSLRSNWRQEQEALYTFHLPEGATVTSLSLWIKGHEEKALLSSRHKADSAYKQIVGAEHRDPSVVHWQEGDRVVVRVFPVLPQETRHFRIGITAPLEKKENRLLYHSIYFDGPSPDGATASVHIQPTQPLVHADPLPTQEQGAYRPDWTIDFDDPGIEETTFQFNGQKYSTEQYIPDFDPTPTQEVYLDLNHAWTHGEFTALLPKLAAKKVWAWQPDQGLVRITDKNSESIFRDAQKLQFSLFPLTAITHKEGSLLITKSTAVSPALSDLNNTDFSKNIPQWLASPGKLCLFNIGDELSPYLKTLKECGAFRFEKGDWDTLHKHLDQQLFIHAVDEPDQVLVDPADLLIRSGLSRSDTDATQGPDHLLRLFAYRRIRQQLNGRLPGDYTSEDPATVDSLVNTAEIANIVSPVSSLVVLESEADYKRFDITQSQNSLQNASLHSNGAVPEPAEWMLLLSVIALVLYIRHRSGRRHTSRRSTISI